MLLEDIDEIEIPRAGPDSDTEDVSGRRKRTTKKSTGRRKVTKKTKEVEEEEEDGVEMLRTATCGSEDVSSKQKNRAAGIKKTLSTVSGKCEKFLQQVNYIQIFYMEGQPNIVNF